MELNNEDEAGLAPRVLLGRRLHRLRERAGVSLRSLADAVHYPHSYISRVERGKQLPSQTLAEALDAYFGTDGVMVESLATARRTTIPRYGRAIVDNELAATRIQVFGGSVIPGLLQTEGYARALFRASLLDASDEQLEGHVATRLKRKAVLEESDQLRYEAVVDEVVLERKVGGAACMADQLRALLHVAEMPRVTVQVLPFERGGHPLLGGSLSLLTFANGAMDGYVESFFSGKRARTARDMRRMTQMYSAVHGAALSAAESRTVIREHLLKCSQGARSPERV
ncbi:helix-turn-helix domain-containing protein [Streptomyces buecherae]|uniref:helix-turn-helix domain-containing protein n=1 Tax=Streptomyces buecherae TaxID=2763006 RepID=UPI001C2704BC|nr:helix-turn-helix transcriptional regulator [Streptomyces buecherae]